MPFETLTHQLAEQILTLTLNIVTGAGRACCTGTDLSAGAKTFAINGPAVGIGATMLLPSLLPWRQPRQSKQQPPTAFERKFP